MSWWDSLSSEEKAAHAAKCTPKRNAQTGKPHANPTGVSQGVRSWWDEFGRENWGGTNNPNWKGGPVDVPYNTLEWRKAAGSARKRDYNTCQDCNQYEDQPKNRLEVHHIDGDPWNHNLNNLVTLCAHCHRLEHGKES